MVQDMPTFWPVGSLGVNGGKGYGKSAPPVVSRGGSEAVDSGVDKYLVSNHRQANKMTIGNSAGKISMPLNSPL